MRAIDLTGESRSSGYMTMEAAEQMGRSYLDETGTLGPVVVWYRNPTGVVLTVTVKPTIRARFLYALRWLGSPWGLAR